MNNWYELTPLDTLFFRGNEPMEAGQPTSFVLFPPPVSVIQGALRTAALKEQGISFADYNRGQVPSEIIELIGASGQPAPFSVTALLVRRNGTLYAPAPANWYLDLKEKPKCSKEYAGTCVVVATSTAADAAIMGVASSSGPVSLVVAQHEALSLAGCWINIRLLSQTEVVFAENDLLFDSDLYGVECRTGIELNQRRTVEEGKLYSGNHIRLQEGVTLLVALDRSPGLGASGLLQLGGEQRKCGHELLYDAFLPVSLQTAKGFVALAPVEVTEQILPKVIAAHKTVVTAGWDLSRGFHKPTTAWFPAGSVFNEKINESCIALAL
jgi:CRISPR-associated protein Cmr3